MNLAARVRSWLSRLTRVTPERDRAQDSVMASKKMLDLAKVTYRQLDLGGKKIEIDFSID